MIPSGRADVVVVGGGIVGLAVAHELSSGDRHGRDVLVLEKGSHVGAQQSSHNSGVVHAGLYYRPGSLKARLCAQGRGLLRSFCADHGVRYDECGKVIVATDAAEQAHLDAILTRATANGVPGVRRVDAQALREIEPHVHGLEAVWSPTTAIVDFPAVCHALAAVISANGGTISCGSEVIDISQDPDSVKITVASQGDHRVLHCRRAVICTGLYADRLAVSAGGSTDPMIVPFRGEYYRLVRSHSHLIRGLVYPVPDPRYPFLGIHLTRHISGQVLVGPNAVLALSREGYSWRDLCRQDVAELLAYRGFRAMARCHWRTGAAELTRSVVRRAFVAQARRYLPELRAGLVERAPAGVRAQAVGRDGQLIDDFVVEVLGRVLALRNAPSPAATSSLAIARHIADQIRPAA